MVTPVILTLIAAVCAAIGAYLVAARQFSGKIATSDASDLWEESRSIRDWATKRIKELGEIVTHLEGRVAELEQHNGNLTSENQRLLRELEECRDKLTA